MVAPHLDRIVYLNGEFIKAGEAKLSIFDRGLLFADAVYEGLGVLDGRIIDFEMHHGRLRRSLGELSIPEPLSAAEIRTLLQRLITDNALLEGFLYLHITRGEADRDYVYSKKLKPNVFAFAQPHDHPLADTKPRGLKLASHPDLRWKRRDIKTSNLLGQVIAKQAAKEAGAEEALLVEEDGFITEGGATSFFIVKNNEILVRPVTNDILRGITRQAMLKVAEEAKLKIVRRKFSLEDAYSADEAFLTGASSYIEPVVVIDGRQIGTGNPGAVTLKLRDEYLKSVGRQSSRST